MEIDGREKDEIMRHGDLRLPEVTGGDLKGPSLTRVMLHLVGIGLGLLLLLVGLGLALSRNMWDRLALFPIILGGALLAGWITVNHDFLRRTMRNRRVMVGTNAIFMGVLALVLLTLLNFVGFRHYARWDMTRAGRFTLSEKTRNVLDSLDRDVTVITVTVARQRTGHEQTAARLNDLLKLYSDASPHVDVRHVRPDTDLAGWQIVARQYDLAPTEVDVAYVISGDRRKAVRMAEMMEWEVDPNNPGRTRPRLFNGERHVTSAILEVMEARQPRVYFLSGHGERDVADSSGVGLLEVAANLRRDNIRVEVLAGIPASGIPQDCEMLAVIGARTAVSRQEAAAIRRYVESGGRLLLAQDVRETSGLEPLLAEWGITFGDDVIISEDAQMSAGAVTAFATGVPGHHEITRPLAGHKMVFNMARSIWGDTKSGHAAVTPLLYTTRASYAETDLDSFVKDGRPRFDAASDTRGPLAVAVAAEQNVPAAQAPLRPVRARIVAFGDVDAFTNDVVRLPYTNLNVIRNSVNWLLERQELIALEARPEIQRALVVDAAASAAVFYILVVGMSFAVLLVGAVVWALRSYGSRSA